MTYKCYDTCSLLEQAGHLFDSDEYTLLITSITLEELENIKTSGNKDADVKGAARHVLQDLDKHYGAFEIILYNELYGDKMLKDGISLTNDAKIIACARHFAAAHGEDGGGEVVGQFCAGNRGAERDLAARAAQVDAGPAEVAD